MTSSFLTRFWSKVAEAPTGCWEWQAYRDPRGYGRFQIHTKCSTLAHRTAYEMATGAEVPASLMVCHKCDNPSCVRPDHLFIGTGFDNQRDRVAKGRHLLKRRCKRGHPLTGENLVWASRTGLPPRRRCLTCDRRSYVNYRRRHTTAVRCRGVVEKKWLGPPRQCAKNTNDPSGLCPHHRALNPNAWLAFCDAESEIA